MRKGVKWQNHSPWRTLLFLLEEEKSNEQDDKKRYNRDFLLGRQFLGASMHRPEGLPSISDVVLDKVGIRHF